MSIRLPPRRFSPRPARAGRARALVTRCAGLIGVLLLGACQAQPGVADPGLKAEATLLARIRTEIGEARCSSDAQCRTLAIGEKACGGPASWLAWSSQQGRADRLQAWSTELAALQRRRNEQSGLMSNCQYIADPGARCIAQRCALTSPGAAN